MECQSAPLRALTDAVELMAAQVAVDLPGPQALVETAALLQLVEHRADVAFCQQVCLDRLQQPRQGGRQQRQPQQVASGQRGDLQHRRDLVPDELNITVGSALVQADQHPAHPRERRVHRPLRRRDLLQLLISWEEGAFLEHMSCISA